MEKPFFEKFQITLFASLVGMITAVVATIFVYFESTKFQSNRVEEITFRLAADTQELRLKINKIESRLAEIEKDISRRDVNLESVQKSIETQINLLKDLTRDISKIDQSIQRPK